MIKSRKVIFISLLLIGLTFLIGGFFYNKIYNNKVKNSPKMFAYQTYWGAVNSVLIIENLEYKDALIKYYETIINDPKQNPVIEVPLKTLPQYEPVYVIGYTDDSLLVNVVSYYNRGAFFGGSFLEGWVYNKILHKTPATRSIR